MEKRILAIVRVLILTVLGTGSSICLAQQDALHGFSGFWQPKFGRDPYGQELIDLLPKGTTFLNDAGAAESGPGMYAGLRLSNRALEEIKNYDPGSQRNPDKACIPPTVVFYMQAPFPMEINEGRDMIFFRMEYYDLFRVIFLDGREHPSEDVPHSKSGHSVGHWEGSTLVVDTTHLSAGTFMNNGFDHSENLHMIEHFKKSADGETLWITQLYEDPDTFQGLVARYIAFFRKPGEYVYPFDCIPDYLSP